MLLGTEAMMSRQRGWREAVAVAVLGLLLAVGCSDEGGDGGVGGDGGGGSSSGGASSGGDSSGGSAAGGSSSSGGSPSGGASGEGGGSASGGASGGGAAGSGATGSGAAGGGTLSDRYPDDEGIASDPSVLFHDDFEAGWGKWTWPDADTAYLHLEQDAALANGGARFLRSTVTADDLAADEYISASPHADLPRRVNQIYWRFYARFKGIAPNPHHWVRVAAGTEAWSSSGLANTVPSGDDGYWFDFDASNDDVFNFYVYWHEMRSGRCNDGTAVPDCEGDQGTTYYYGNVFEPPEQTPFPRDTWFCIEIMGKGNTPGSSDGELAFYIDDRLIGEYRPGYPTGTWLRATFHTGGCDFSACTEPAPFEGFDFRSSDDVLYKQIFLDAYYERGTFEDKKAALEERGLVVSDEQTIYYDDVVVATERIGCKAPR